MDWQYLLPGLFVLGGLLCAFVLGYGVGHRAGKEACRAESRAGFAAGWRQRRDDHNDHYTR